MKIKFLSGVLALMMSVTAMAATSGTLLLRGTVPLVLSITIEPETVATTLPLSTTQSDTLVAVFRELSNSNTGYTVSISSANLGKLVHETDTASVINYTLKYNGNAINLATGSSFSESTRGLKNRQIRISYTGVPAQDLAQGNYEDVLTLTIAAN